MYVGTEMVLPNYLPTILGKTTTLRDSALAISITAIWASMTIGRLCMTFIIDRIGHSKLFAICYFGDWFSFGVFAVSPHVHFTFAALMLSVPVMGDIFP